MSQDQPVDHAWIASETLETVRSYGEFEDDATSIAFAQVHATLAVAQELRRWRYSPRHLQLVKSED